MKNEEPINKCDIERLIDTAATLKNEVVDLSLLSKTKHANTIANRKSSYARGVEELARRIREDPGVAAEAIIYLCSRDRRTLHELRSLAKYNRACHKHFREIIKEKK